jgi:hypothetical protein
VKTGRTGAMNGGAVARARPGARVEAVRSAARDVRTVRVAPDAKAAPADRNVTLAADHGVMSGENRAKRFRRRWKSTLPSFPTKRVSSRWRGRSR